MDILTKRTVLEKFPDHISKLAEENNLEQVEYVEKGAFIPEKQIEIDIEERTVVKYISAISVDRDDDIILPDGGDFKDFRKHPVVLYAHRHGADMFGGGDPTLPIGKAIWIKADKFGVKAKIKFNNTDLATSIFDMYKDGFPLASSIGFIPLDGSRNDGSKAWKDLVKQVKDKYGMSTKEINSAKQIFTKWYLLEDSEVPVPANQDALALAFKEGTFKCKSVELSKDLELEKIMQEELEKKIKDLELELSGSQIANSELQKQIDESLVTITEKDAEIERIKAEKPKFTKEMADSLIGKGIKEITDHLKMKTGEV